MRNSNYSNYLIIVLIFLIEYQSDIYGIYWHVEQKCRKYTKIIGCYPLKLMFVGTLTYSIVCLANGNRDTSTWKLVYFFSLPIDREKISGWYMAWMADTGIGMYF